LPARRFSIRVHTAAAVLIAVADAFWFALLKHSDDIDYSKTKPAQLLA
jgi:hypothetical protein